MIENLVCHVAGRAVDRQEAPSDVPCTPSLHRRVREWMPERAPPASDQRFDSNNTRLHVMGMPAPAVITLTHQVAKQLEATGPVATHNIAYV